MTNSTCGAANTIRIDITLPLEYENDDGTTLITMEELLNLRLRERHAAKALATQGIQLGPAYHVSEQRVHYSSGTVDDAEPDLDSVTSGLRHFVAEADAPRKEESPAHDIRNKTLQPKVKIDVRHPSTSAGLSNNRERELEHTRKNVRNGPENIGINGEIVPFAEGLAPSPPRRHTQATTSVEITGTEHHLMDHRGYRYRSENPDDTGDVTGDTDVRMAGIHTEVVLIYEPSVHLISPLPD